MSRLNALSYHSIRWATTSIGRLPSNFVNSLGKWLGRALYYLLPKFRKRALSNLALATDLNLSNKEIPALAKLSFENLATTLLEYGKLCVCKNLDFVTCENHHKAEQILKGGKGVIFFCAHQANWEILFLEGASRMPGVAIGRPIKNKLLYQWITTIRERFGGTIIAPKDAIKEGLRALKQGKFLGIVGDQGMPESNFSTNFLGRRAYTSPVPALLAYKTGCPIIFAETVRLQNGNYKIRYNDPIYADTSKPKGEEVFTLMSKVLSQLELSIKRHPDQWMWQHNRWKQETPAEVFYAYRYDSILIILPKHFDPEIPKLLRAIYPRVFITALAPSKVEKIETILYTDEPLIDDYRFKLVFNFTDFPVARHYLKFSAHKVLSISDLRVDSLKRKPNASCPLDIIKWAICRSPENY